jgi:ribonuclease P protein component
MSVRVSPSKRSDYRLAVVVSKKVSKSAVVRNRIRRRLYETVRILKKELNVEWPFDIVLTVYDERLAQVPAEEIRASIVRLFEKTHIIKTQS